MRLTLGVALCATVAAGSLLTAATVAEAHHDFRFAPKIGKAKTKFTITFTADLSEVGPPDDQQEFYIAAVRGPRGCRDVAGFPNGPVVAGQPVTIQLRPVFSIFPLLERTTWCAGRYRGALRFCHCATGDLRPDVVVRRFSFKVKPKRR